jgi:hypothetical protein
LYEIFTSITLKMQERTKGDRSGVAFVRLDPPEGFASCSALLLFESPPGLVAEKESKAADDGAGTDDHAGGNGGNATLRGGEFENAESGASSSPDAGTHSGYGGGFDTFQVCFLLWRWLTHGFVPKRL